MGLFNPNPDYDGLLPQLPPPVVASEEISVANAGHLVEGPELKYSLESARVGPDKSLGH